MYLAALTRFYLDQNRMTSQRKMVSQTTLQVSA